MSTPSLSSPPPPPPPALDADAVAGALRRLPGWRGDAQCLQRTYAFASFPAAIAYMQACVAPIEAANHHPDWSNSYRRVEVRLCTHDAGDRVTALDVALAATLEDLARRHGAT